MTLVSGTTILEAVFALMDSFIRRTFAPSPREKPSKTEWAVKSSGTNKGVGRLFTFLIASPRLGAPRRSLKCPGFYLLLRAGYKRCRTDARIFNPFSGLRAFSRPGFSVRVCRFSSLLPRRDEKGKKPDASLFDPCPAARSRMTNFESVRNLPFRSRRLYKAKPRRSVSCFQSMS
jgi:hypothetical protein